MNLGQVLLLMAYAMGLSLGQLLFKHAALRLEADRLAMPLWRAVLVNYSLFGALVLYAALTGLWVFILTRTELSKAYPFIALTLVITPLLASRLFGETLSGSYFFGLAAIVLGLIVISSAGGTP